MFGAIGWESSAGWTVPSEQSFELSFRSSPLNERSGNPLLIGMGDPTCGPLVGLFYDAPSSPDELGAAPDLGPAHSHPCDNFRIVLKGELAVGPDRYRHGEFRLQRTGHPYGSDGDLPHLEGNWRIIMFGDRRGYRMRPTNQTLRSQLADPAELARVKQLIGDVVPEVLPDDDDGVEGLATSIDKPFSRRGHIDSSFAEADTWADIGDGASGALALLGAHECGPVTLLQRTPPGRSATPPCTFDSDVFRCVIRGSHTSGDATSVMGDVRIHAAGVPWAEVFSGADGLDEVIIVADRRGAQPRATHDPHGWGARFTSIMEDLQSALPSMAPG